VNTTMQLISLGVSLIAIFIAIFLPNWPRIREWWVTLEDDEKLIVAQDQAEYLACCEEMHEAGHPLDVERYDITRPMPLPEPWDVVPPELRATCYRDDDVVND